MRGLGLLDWLTGLSALGCGVAGGFFFAFSVCVMKALGRLPPAQGMAAMQSINVVVINPGFLAVFFGTALACLGAIVSALLRWPDPRAPYWLLGGALYLVGTILVTMVCNVPRNNALAALAPSRADAAGLWAGYLSTWTAWNHVRSIAAVASAMLFLFALRLRG